MLFFTLLMSLGIEPSHQLPLPRFTLSPVFAAEADGSIWLADRKESWVQHLDENGQELITIDYGGGEGPGEIVTPRALIPFPNHQTLIVVSRYGRTQAFHAQTGAFKSRLISFRPNAACLKWDADSFLMVWASSSPATSQERAFQVIGLDGTVKKSFNVPQPSWQKKYTWDSPRGYALGQDKTVFIGYMGEPKVFVYPFPPSQPTSWLLPFPKGYREPPKQELSRADMFNREKTAAYFRSFSFIDHVFSINDQQLIVTWKHAEQDGFFFDLFDVPTRKRLLSNIPVKGKVIGTSGHRMYSFQTLEAVGPDEEEKQVLHVTSMKPWVAP